MQRHYVYTDVKVQTLACIFVWIAGILWCHENQIKMSQQSVLWNVFKCYPINGESSKKVL